MPWIEVCDVDSLDEGEAVRVDVDPPVAVFCADGEHFAIDDTCSHGQSSLSEGYVDDCVVECIWHYARFDLRSGKALTAPATVNLQTYPVAIREGRIFVQVDPGAAASESDTQ